MTNSASHELVQINVPPETSQGRQVEIVRASGALLVRGSSVTNGNWRAHAVCRNVDPDLFYPIGNDRETLEEAKAVCAECPVREDCLDHALGNNELLGVWGGTSERERRKIRQRIRRQTT